MVGWYGVRLDVADELVGELVGEMVDLEVVGFEVVGELVGEYWLCWK
jgi:hypothetical protein